MTLPYEFARVSDGRVFVISKMADFDQHYAITIADRQSLFQPSQTEAKFLLGSESILLNGTFTDDATTWRSANGLPATVFYGVDFAEDARLIGLPTAYLSGHAGTLPFGLTYHDPIFGDLMPILAGQTYRFEGLFAAHRAIGSVEVTFLDDRSNNLSTLSQTLTEHRGGAEPADCQHVSITGDAPPGSCHARLSIRFLRSHNAVRDMTFFLFFTDLAFGLVEASPSGEAGPGWTRSLLALMSGHSADRIFSARFDIEMANDALRSIDLVRIDQRSDERLVIYDTAAASNNVSAHINLEDGRIIRVTISGATDCSVFCDGARVQSSSKKISNQALLLELPNDLLDGQPHLFEVRDSAGVTILARDYFLVPSITTPWPILQEHSAPRPPFYLAPAARDRYRSLLGYLDNGLGDVSLEQLRQAHQVVSLGFTVNRDFSNLRFPQHDTPEVSIVIPVHNKFEVTYFCLNALLLAFNKALFEVVLVDDGSSDRTRKIEEVVSGIKVVRNEIGSGFIGACNRGAMAATGQFIVFLNNDTEPTADWLDELLECFKLFKNVGMAGSKLIYPDGSLQEAGGIVWGNGNPWNYGRDQNALDPRYTYTRDADYLSGAAIMLPRDIWDKVGGFSTEFMPAYFEDVDLAFKVRALGYRTLYVATSIVYHFEGVTGGTDVTSGAKRNQELNRPKFKSKWINAYRTHGKEGVEPDLEKDRGAVGRVLVVDYQTPKPDADAGSYAVIQEMLLIQAMGYKVYFLPQNFAYLGRHTEYLQKLGIETLYHPFYRSVNEVFQSIGKDLDAVYMVRYYVGKYCIDAARRLAPQAKLIMNNCDLHFLRELRAGIANGDKQQIERAVQMRDEELAVMREVDLNLSYNEVEHAVIMSHNGDRGRVMRVPWVETLTSEVPRFSERSGIAFLGGFNHPPNKEAVSFFAGKVMPILRLKGFQTKFFVYGSGMSRDIEALSADDIVIRGYVRDLGDVYDSCRVFVAPLISGAGIKGKVLGALAHGVPCVLSPVAAEGIGLRHGYDCWIVQSPAEWAEAVEHLSTDEALWSLISRRGRELIQANYSFGSGLATMRQAFESLGLFTP